jgi:hypothetical protein
VRCLLKLSDDILILSEHAAALNLQNRATHADPDYVANVLDRRDIVVTLGSARRPWIIPACLLKVVPGQVYKQKADSMTKRAIRLPAENHLYIENDGKTLFGIDQGGDMVSQIRRHHPQYLLIVAAKLLPRTFHRPVDDTSRCQASGRAKSSVFHTGFSSPSYFDERGRPSEWLMTPNKSPLRY